MMTHTEQSLEPKGVISRYRDLLPVSPETPVITLGEGNTPLLPAPALSREVGRDCAVFVKFEGMNPTGSFKDRGMTVAISKAIEQGITTVLCASTGNTSASAAAYAARAGIRCVVLLPAGKTARGKLLQAVVHGARVIAVKGNFDDALRLVRSLGDRPGYQIVNSINPDRIAGQMTASFEVVDVLGSAPDYHFLPVGNAGNITAYWHGYLRYRERWKCTNLPRMFGFQAAGAAPLFRDEIVSEPKTVASAIRIGNPASWQEAKAAISDSNGVIEIVTDEEILQAQRWLASHEGIFVEPASAAPIAGLLKIVKENEAAIATRSTIVCTVTGHGLKDPDAVAFDNAEVITVAPTEEAVLEVLQA